MTPFLTASVPEPNGSSSCALARASDLSQFFLERPEPFPSRRVVDHEGFERVNLGLGEQDQIGRARRRPSSTQRFRKARLISSSDGNAEVARLRHLTRSSRSPRPNRLPPSSRAAEQTCTRDSARDSKARACSRVGFVAIGRFPPGIYGSGLFFRDRNDPCRSLETPGQARIRSGGAASDRIVGQWTLKLIDFTDSLRHLE